MLIERVNTVVYLSQLYWNSYTLIFAEAYNLLSQFDSYRESKGFFIMGLTIGFALCRPAA